MDVSCRRLSLATTRLVAVTFCALLAPAIAGCRYVAPYGQAPIAPDVGVPDLGVSDVGGFDVGGFDVAVDGALIVPPPKGKPALRDR
jgi:hypothetical protein